MDDPCYLERALFEQLRKPRGLEVVLDGLWTVGSLESLGRPSVAIVGTRAATPHGRQIARSFARALGQAGCTILSGLALGIDTAAHEGALDAQAPTVAVLGSGHRQFFPPRNLSLAERIVAGGGAVLSPYPPDQPAFPKQFLQRNGVVAALADAVVVIEAPARSGALNTASWAAGRIPVFAVPGDVDRPHVQGCLALLRDGALLARNADDVLEVLSVQIARPTSRAARTLPHDPAERAILAALSEGEAHLDALVNATSLPIPALLASLASLELGGYVESRPGGLYATLLRTCTTD